MPNGKLNGFRSTPIHDKVAVLLKRIQEEDPGANVTATDIGKLAYQTILAELSNLSSREIEDRLRELKRVMKLQEIEGADNRVHGNKAVTIKQKKKRWPRRTVSTKHGYG